jgi:hypothetical protein
VSFTRDLQPIFTASCTALACHGAPVPALGLDLRAGQAYAALLTGTAAALSCGGSRLVIPGDPDGSVLVRRVSGTTCGARMPAIGSPLSPVQVGLIRSWIEGGAPDN